jgi:hypothetical protein
VGKEAIMAEQRGTPVGPDFARGQEKDEDSPEKHRRPRFSRGQEAEVPDEQHRHEGDFAAGQEKEPHHPEAGDHGRFSKGQDHRDDVGRKS